MTSKAIAGANVDSILVATKNVTDFSCMLISSTICVLRCFAAVNNSFEVYTIWRVHNSKLLIQLLAMV